MTAETGANPTISDEIIAAGGLRPGPFLCIHCGIGPALISLFCSRACQAECLAECGSRSSSGVRVTGDGSSDEAEPARPQ